MSQNFPSITRDAAEAFGFLTFIQAFDGPERYSAFSFFETIRSRPSLQTRLKFSASSYNQVARSWNWLASELDLCRSSKGGNVKGPLGHSTYYPRATGAEFCALV